MTQENNHAALGGTNAVDGLAEALRPGEVTVMAGRPGAGNTVLAIRLILIKGLKLKIPVYVFSNQGYLDTWIDRLPWEAANLSEHRILEHRVAKDEQASLCKIAKELTASPLHFARMTAMPPECLGTYIHEVTELDENPGLVVIDYFQWNGRDHQEHEHRLRKVMADLKKVAVELQTPVLLLSNLRRSIERRENKRPRLSDMPAHGVQDSTTDQVWLLYRPQMYCRPPSTVTEIDQLEVDCYRPLESGGALHARYSL